MTFRTNNLCSENLNIREVKIEGRRWNKGENGVLR